MKTYLVTWTARFQTTVELKFGEYLVDAIAGIDIPENSSTSYISGSWEIKRVEDEKGKCMDESEYEEIVG